MVGTVLDSGARISCVGEATVCAMHKWFPGVDVVQPDDDEQHQVVFADGRAVPIERKTCSLTATIMTPWAPVTIRLALVVMPGEDDLLVLRSKTLREKLSIDVMKQLRDTAAASGAGASTTEHAPAEVPAMPPEIIGVRRVAVTMEAMQVADIESEADGETNGFEHLLEDAVLRAARAGMPPDNLVELRCLVLGLYKEAFRWGLTGEPPAQVELVPVQVRSMAAYACPDADYSLPSKSSTKDKKLELVELVGGQTSVRTTFDPDSVRK